MMRRITAACLLLLACAAGAAADGAKPIETISDVDRSARVAMFKAQEKTNAGEPEAAATILLDFLAEHEENDHFLLRYQLGNALVRLDRTAEAVDHYRRAVAMEDRYAPAWTNLGEAAYNLGDYELAATALERGFRRSGEKRADVLFYAAAARLMSSDAAGAASLLEELVSGTWGEPGLDWFRALISACIDLDDEPRGWRAVDGLLERFGDDPEAWILAFQHAAASGDYRRAAVDLTVAGYLRPLTREERIQLGDLYTAIGVPYAATSWYEGAIADGGAANEYERLASAWLAAYEVEQAKKTIREGLDRKPTARLWSLLGDLHYMEREFEEARSAFARCVEIDPEYGRAHLMMGYCAIEQQRWGEAVRHLEAAASYPRHEQAAREMLRRARAMLASS